MFNKKKTETFINDGKEVIKPQKKIQESKNKPIEEFDDKEIKKEKTPKIKTTKDFKKIPFLKSKTSIIATALVISGIISFIILPIINIMSKGSEVTIIIANQDIKKGDIFTFDNLIKKNIPKSIFEEHLIEDSKDIIGKYAVREISKGDYLTDTKISTIVPFPDEYLYNLPDGKKAISIDIQNFASGVSGKLLPGDLVSIYTVLGGEKDDENYYAIQPQELSYVEILAVTIDSGLDITSENKNSIITDTSTNTTVTILADNIQASVLAHLNTNAAIHLALVNRGNNLRKDELLAIQYELLSKMEVLNNAKE